MVEPQPSRYLRTKYGISPTSEHVQYVKTLRWWMSNYKEWVIDETTPVACYITYFLTRPAKTLKVLPTGRPDLDNLTKPTLDSIKPEYVKRKLKQLGVIKDDAQITDLYVRKRFARKVPHIKIKLWVIHVEQSKDKPFSTYPIQQMLELMP